MIKRHHQILAAVLVAQLVLSVVVFWPQSSAVGEREALFPELDVQDVIHLTIEDDTGRMVELSRVSDDWVVPEADDYPAQTDAVNGLLEKLTTLSTGRLVAGNQTSHKRLEVAGDAFARRITFETSDGDEGTIYVGSSPQFGSVHFRMEGQNETYLTSELTTWDADPTVQAWIDTAYQSVVQDHVTLMRLENANGTFVFRREGEDTWTMVEPASLEEGESLNQAQVRSVLRRAASVTMREPLGKEEKDAYGLDEPTAVVTLETDDNPVTLYVGAKDDDAGYVVKSSESDYYVLVATTAVSALVENGREAFVQEPTPLPESSDS